MHEWYRIPLACLPPHFAGAVAGAVAALLKQGVERIARVRAAATLHLRALVAEGAVPGGVPAALTLAAALPSNEVELTGKHKTVLEL